MNTAVLDTETAGQRSQPVTELNRVIESRHGEDVAPTRAGATRARARDADAILFTAGDDSRASDAGELALVGEERTVTTTTRTVTRRLVIRTSILPGLDTAHVCILPAEPEVRAVRRQRLVVVGGVALIPLMLCISGMYLAQGHPACALFLLMASGALAALAAIEGRRPVARRNH